MIDIVVPYYDDSDEHWRNILREYMQKENSNDRQVIGDERYRDWECFNYWFRCVEQNCKWVNKVFLIVACESQIPDWVDRTNQKLRIVYHNEFIPEELLPTFNTMTIELFISRIKDLSNNYIYCNDDYFFLNETTADMFFKDDIPVYKENEGELVKFDDGYLNGSDGTFYSVLNNGIDLQLEICGDKAKWYTIDHLPVSHKKDFELEIIEKFYDRFIEANKTSRFRNKEMFSNHVFVCLYKDLMPYYKAEDYSHSYYLTIRKDINFNDHANCKMVCFNDTEQLNAEDFEKVKVKMRTFFEQKFPIKSSYEK